MIPSGPHHLVVPNPFNILYMHFSTQHFSRAVPCGGKSGAYSSVSIELKQVAKNGLKAFAFLDAVDITIPL